MNTVSACYNLKYYESLLQYKVGRRLGDGQGGSVPLSHQLGVGGAEPGGAPLDVNNVLLTQALTRQRVAPVLTTKKKHHHCPSLCLTGGRGGEGSKATSLPSSPALKNSQTLNKKSLMS